MKILYIITAPDRGGAQTHVLDLISQLYHSIEVELATGGEGFLTEAVRALGVKVHLVPTLVRPIRPHKDIRLVRDLGQLIQEVQPDLVHCHSTKAGLVGRLAAHKKSVPGLVTIHGWTFSDGFGQLQRNTGRFLERYVAGFGQHIIVVADAQKELALAHKIASPNQLVTIHNGILDHEARALPGESVIVPRIIMVARFQKPKDHLFAVRALAGVDVPWELEFVGDGPLEAEVKEEVNRLNLSKRVRFMGNRDDVPERLAQAHIFLLASNSEAFPLSILEGMRAGLPVISSNVGGVAESVIESETGFLFERRDMEILRTRLRACLSDPALRAAMGAAGRRRFETHFTQQRMIEKTLEMYEACIQSPVVLSA